MTGRGIDQILASPAEPTLHEPYVKDSRQYVELAEAVNGAICRPVPDAYPWGEALKILHDVAPDARIINLETAITSDGKFASSKEIHYRMSPQNIGCVTAAKIDCCTLANNHVLDWGQAGFLETLQTLEHEGVKICGAGIDRQHAAAPAVLPIEGGGRILVFGYALPTSGVPPSWAASRDRPGIAFLSDLSDDAFEEIAQAISAARRWVSDVAVVSIHWGGNWGYEIPAAHRRFAHRLIDDAGVAIVHGHSSHHVKGIEVYRDHLILYGCGDLINDYEGISGQRSYRANLGLLYFPELDPSTGKLRALRMFPTQTYRLSLRTPPPDDVAWLHTRLNREGERFGTWVRQETGGAFLLEWQGTAPMLPH